MNVINTETNASYGFVAPNVPADGDKKKETVFPTAETVHPMAESGVFNVPLRRQATVVNLGTVEQDHIVILSAEPANLNAGAVVVVEFDGLYTVDVSCANPGDSSTTPVCRVQGSADATTAVVLVWDGTRLVPCGDSAPLCNEQLTPKVDENGNAKASITKHDTYIRIEKLVQDSTLYLKTENAPLGARVIVRFNCGSTAYRLLVKPSGGVSTEIQGTADEATVKELVWNGSGFDVIG